MSKRRTERLLSIVVLLLSSRRYLTAEEIRAAVRGYPDEHEAFKRMFERDKEELRELGIPLETGVNNALDEEPGYRIKKQDYELPEIRLEADEAAVLGIASRVWQSAALAGAAAGALLKLKAAAPPGSDQDDDKQSLGIEPRLSTQEPAFGPLWEAVRDHRPVTFDHIASGRSTATKRELEPWGVVNRRGRWYVAGHDRTRNAARVFRLSRITGPVKMARPGGQRHRPAGCGRPRAGEELGRLAGPRPHRGAQSPRGRRFRTAPLGQRGHAGRNTRLGPGHGELRRRALVRGPPRLVRPRRHGARAAGPARGGHPPAQGDPRVSGSAATAW